MPVEWFTTFCCLPCPHVYVPPCFDCCTTIPCLSWLACLAFDDLKGNHSKYMPVDVDLELEEHAPGDLDQIYANAGFE